MDHGNPCRAEKRSIYDPLSEIVRAGFSSETGRGTNVFGRPSMNEIGVGGMIGEGSGSGRGRESVEMIGAARETIDQYTGREVSWCC